MMSPGTSSRGRRGACALANVLAASLVLAVAGGALAIDWPWRSGDEAPPVYPDVTATGEWLAERLGGRGIVVADARPAGDYALGHIPGAVSVPFDQLPDPRHAAEAFGALGLSGRGRIVCYGSDLLDGAAAGLFWLLDAAGAEGAMLLEGGLEAWEQRGGTLVATPTNLSPASWSGAYRPGRAASSAYVALKFGEEGHVIVDTRGWDAWHGSITEAEWGEPKRDGHVPHALPYDFTEFISSDGGFRAADETRDFFARVGPRPSTPVDLTDEFIVHGRGGADGAIGYFLLRRAGLTRVRYFAGGWSEWVADLDLPIVRIVEADEVMHRLAKARRWFRPNDPPSTFVFFDVRHWGSYAGGYIAGAASLTSTFFADSLDVYLERDWPEIDRSTTPIVTYCYGANCIRSRNCSTLAARMGFVNVERFYEGLNGWRLAGGELRRDPAVVEAMQERTDKAIREAQERREAETGP